jgi:tetratricopeptide (TPR) repeat protein
VASLVPTVIKGKKLEKEAFMSLVAHKYTPAEMSDQELEATFAARDHTVEYLLKALRDQTESGTLSSFVLTAPRGAGKSTVIHMVALRIRQDTKLNAAWLPVVLPEEQFNITSLRDLLATTLEVLGKDGIAEANIWLEKVQAEPDDEQSQQLAITGLKEITKRKAKRLILFVENLNILLEESLDDKMKGTLRRLLMTDPFMMLIGSSVHLFNSLKQYHEAFFNYFGQVPLDRLDADQVFELLKKRAQFDGNDRFLKEFPKQQPKIRAIVHLSGGNPRLTLMLYELLSQQQVTSIVQYLRRLVDELTPLLKDEMENLPPQQRKIIHALMEKGGTATPTDLVQPTRLPLNAITTQLKRLKDAQIVELLGGGKGRTANYTIPDKLFAIWYQMRYLSQNRRRIELFVEVLRIWFEEQERIETLRSLARSIPMSHPQALSENATAAEYFAASLKGTAHEKIATDICIEQWVKADLREAALAYVDLAPFKVETGHITDASAFTDLAGWLNEHGDPQRAWDALDQALAKPPFNGRTHAKSFLLRGTLKFRQGDVQAAIRDYTAALELDGATKEQIAWALMFRALSREKLGDMAEAIVDYTAILQLEGIPKEQIASALLSRGVSKRALGNLVEAIADYDALLEQEGASKEQIASALVNRGFSMETLGNVAEAISDYNAVLETKEALKEDIALALVNRGVIKGKLGDLAAAIADFNSVLELEGAPKEQITRALLNRGVSNGKLGDMAAAIANYDAVMELEGVPKEYIALTLFNRAIELQKSNQTAKAIADLITVIESGITSEDLIADSARLAFIWLWNSSDHDGAKAILSRFSAVIVDLPVDFVRESMVGLLSNLASPELKTAWPIAWRILADANNPVVTEALEFLQPVSAILEGRDPVLLDSLPPEQRDFVQSVVARFAEK